MSGYESYVAIPLPWLSQMPSHWTLLRNKNFLQEVKETVGIDSADYTLLSLTKNGIIPRDVASGKGKFPKDFDTYKVVTSGDLAFCLFDIDETPRTVGLSKHDGMLTGAYTVFHLSGINSQFITYYYLALDNVKALRPLYSGLRKTIKTNIFLGTKLPLPPLSEQVQIVRYLDWKVSKTNKLISALKKQIILLKEQKQAIVNEAVTKGLDPNVPMKDSGVEWIGEIPTTWSVCRLKSIVKLSSDKRMWDNDFYIGMENIQSWTGKYIETKEAKPESICGTFRPGDVLFGKLRPYLAKVFLTDCEGTSSNEFLILHDYEGCTRYLYYLLLCYKFIQLVNASTYGAKMPRANWSFIGNCTVPNPCEEEQKEIADFLDSQSAKIDALIENINREITVLGEYRTRLISDVVTGQIDVRAVEVPDFEYITDEADDVSDDENSEVEEAEEE